MSLLITGLVLFLGIHVVPMAPRLRALVVTRLGEQRYRAAFSLISAVGLVLIIVGYWMRLAPTQLFAPVPAARAAAPIVVTLAFVLFVAANMQTHIRRAVQHPMLIGLMLWSGVHLLANGDAAGTILFGSFLVYSAVDLVSAVRRRAVKPFVPAWKYDAIAVIAGIALAVLAIRFHAPLFGTGAVA